MPEKKDLENYYTSGAYYNHRPDHGNLKVLNYIFNQSASRFNLINNYINFGNIKNLSLIHISDQTRQEEI